MRVARRRGAGRRSRGSPRLASRFLFAILWQLRLPLLGWRALPVLIVVALIAGGGYATASYNAGQGQAFLQAARRFAPALNADLRDGAAAATSLQRVSQQLIAGRGPDTVNNYGAQGRNLADRARSAQAQLRDLRLFVAGFEQLPVLQDATAAHTAELLATASWYDDAQDLLGVWLQRGESAQQLADSTKSFVAGNVASEFTNVDPFGQRNEILLRLDGLARELQKTSEDLAQKALTGRADSAAARMAPRFAQLAETVGKARVAVDTRSAKDFARYSEQYVKDAAALQADLIGEMQQLAAPGDEQARIQPLIDTANATVQQVSTR